MSRTRNPRPHTPMASAPPPRVRVALYRRASTDEANQPYSLDAQEERLRRYVDAHPEWTVVADFVERASAKDVSGRPQLLDLLDQAADGAFDRVVVARIDRWSRSLMDLLDTVNRLDQVGVGFHSATEEFDTASPMGRLTMQMLGVFAEFERSLIIDRIRRGNAAKIARGIPLTSRVGYGLSVDEQGQVVSDPATFGTVQRIFAEYTAGEHGTKAIAARLNADHLPAPGRRPWSAQSVSHVLANRTFLGELWHRDRWYPGAHEPLIDPDLYARAEALTRHRSSPATAARRRGNYLLSGTITCARCGGAYVGTAGTSRTRQQVRYYSCGASRRYGAATCDGPTLPATELEALVTDALLEAYADPVLFAEAITAARAQHATTTAPAAAELDVVRAELAKKRRVLDRYQADYEAGELTAARYEQRAAELEADVTALTARQDTLQRTLNGPQTPETPTPAEHAALLDHLRRAVRTGDIAARKDLFTALVERVEVRARDDIRPTFRLYGLHPAATAEGDCEG